ncbi:glycosyltransferase family 4 protein [Flagellimonas pacifica]|uniref:Glycosyltransferase Family 4 n=1 Tax=Flagellimonas pacifica TaxID=1247520 RepID=A0A285MR38_9FLAO|nr:glycosyltransferase family 4 protein [Allomuricauda parva]SNY99642.1 Glycosyltransferase Family 4 [Allomuricauda parva]
MKKVIFLALGYPHVDRSTILYTDLMQEFAQKGHEVLVVAPAFQKNDYGCRVEGNVKVLRVPTLPLFKVGAIKKGIANLLLPFQYKRAIRKYSNNFDYDLIILPTPPITLITIASWLKKKSSGKIYLILRDIFPQNAVDLNMIGENGLLHRYFRKKELKLYNVSDAIGCMSNANVSYVKQHNPEVNPKKLHLLPNWEKLPAPISQKEISDISDKFEIKDKFVAIFGGNLGRPQKMENIVNLAKSCESYKDILILILGSGTEQGTIKRLISKFDLTNIKLIDRLPKKEYIQVLAAADIGLISLSEEFTIPNFPSKVLTYFGLKKPVLASLDLHTDFGQMLEETKSGLWAEAGNIDDLKSKLLWFYNNKVERDKMGENGYVYMKSCLTPEIAHKTIISKIG